MSAGDQTPEGTWRVEGDTVYVTFMEEQATLQIEGSGLTFQNTELERIE